MLKLITIGNIHIYLLGLTTAIGVIIAYLVASSEIKKRGLNKEIFENLIIYSLISAFIGARLFYIFVFNPTEYIQNPQEIFKITSGGMSIQGGLIFAFAFAWFFLKKKKKNFLEYSDAIIPSVPLAQFIGRIGCDVFGKPMNSPQFWAVLYQGELVHPVQIYEAILNLLLFVYLKNKNTLNSSYGDLTSDYLIGYGSIRFFVEFFRFNPIVFGPLTVAHVTSILIIFVGLLIKRTSTNKYHMDYSIRMNKVIFILIMAVLAFLAIGIYYTIR